MSQNKFHKFQLEFIRKILTLPAPGNTYRYVDIPETQSFTDIGVHLQTFIKSMLPNESDTVVDTKDIKSSIPISLATVDKVKMLWFVMNAQNTNADDLRKRHIAKHLKEIFNEMPDIDTRVHADDYTHEDMRRIFTNLLSEYCTERFTEIYVAKQQKALQQDALKELESSLKNVEVTNISSFSNFVGHALQLVTDTTAAGVSIEQLSEILAGISKDVSAISETSTASQPDDVPFRFIKEALKSHAMFIHSRCGALQTIFNDEERATLTQQTQEIQDGVKSLAEIIQKIESGRKACEEILRKKSNEFKQANEDAQPSPHPTKRTIQESFLVIRKLMSYAVQKTYNTLMESPFIKKPPAQPDATDAENAHALSSRSQQTPGNIPARHDTDENPAKRSKTTEPTTLRANEHAPQGFLEAFWAFLWEVISSA
jgi:hypothetical protein